MLARASSELREIWSEGRPLVAEHYCNEDIKNDDILMIRKGLEPTLAENQHPPVNRIHTCTAVSTFGKPICEFKSNLELLRTLRDAIEGHWRLFKEANILHHDVSLYNIMIGEGHGFIIDLDYAIDYDDQRKPESLHRTGML